MAVSLGLVVPALLAAWLVGCRDGQEAEIVSVPVQHELTLEVPRRSGCGTDGGCERGTRRREYRGMAGIVTDRDAIRLREGAAAEVAVRLPDASRVQFEARARHAAVVVEVSVPGEPARLLHRSEKIQADDGWHAVDVPTELPEGTIALVTFGVERPDPAHPGFAELRRPRIAGTLRRALSPPVVPPRPVNVVVYLIDTLRADRLGCYGSPEARTPRIDAFAGESIRFTRMVANSSWTRPATASVFTGRIPPRHGALEADQAIRSDVVTLPEILQRQGYATGAFVTNVVASAPFGFARGFDVFRLYPARPDRESLFVRAQRIVPRVEHWLGRVRPPFFAYVHVVDPHSPYVPPDRFRRPLRADVTEDAVRSALEGQRECTRCLQDLARERPTPITSERAAALSVLYDGEVTLSDAAFGEMLDMLRRAGVLDDTVVILTSDHGEEFLEHEGMTHGKSLYREVLDVPLLVRLPGGARGGTVDTRLVQQADVLPSILDVLGLAIPDGLDGEAVFRDGGPRQSTREIVSHLHHDGRTLLALTDDRWTFIHNIEGPEAGPAFEVYDRLADPDQQEDIGRRDRVLAAYGRRRLRHLRLAGDSGSTVRLEPALQEKLRALGYLGP
jgi:arylsulfatase A-like enzyme